MHVAKITLDLYVEVEDDAQAQEACNALTSLDSFIAGSFPAGDPIHTDVTACNTATDAELDEHGLTE